MQMSSLKMHKKLRIQREWSCNGPYATEYKVLNLDLNIGVLITILLWGSKLQNDWI